MKKLLIFLLSLSLFLSISTANLSSLGAKSNIGRAEKKQYIIVVGKSELLEIVRNFMNFKINEGFVVKVETVEDIKKNYSGVDLAEQIRNYLKDKIADDSPTYTLLIGTPYNKDDETSISTGGDIPMRYVYPFYDELNNYYDYSYPTDFYYCDLKGDWDKNGDNHYGSWNNDEIVETVNNYVGRIPSSDPLIVKKVLDSIINIEREIKKEGLNYSALLAMQQTGGDDHPESDTALWGEEIRKEILEPNGFSVTTLYEKEGDSPSTYDCTAPLNNSNFKQYFPKNDIVVTDGHGGVVRTIWHDKNKNGKLDKGERSFSTFFTVDTLKYLSESGYRTKIFYDWGCNTFDISDNNSSFVTANSILFSGLAGAVIATTESVGYPLDLPLFFETVIINKKTVGEYIYDPSRTKYKSGRHYIMKTCILGDPSLSLFPPSVRVPSIPQNLTVIISNRTVAVNWSPSSQGTYPISGYEIYRRENASNDKKLIATVDSDTFTYIDKNVLKGKTYFYSIRAFDSKGNYSDYSNEVKVTIPSGPFPPGSIFYKVNTLSLTELVGPILATNSDAIPIITGDEDTSPPYAVVGIASRKGRGRVIGLGHEAFLSDSEKNLNLFDNAKFTANVLKWLDVNKKGKILLTTGHGEWLNSGNTLTLKQIAIDSGFTFSITSDRLTDKLLENVGVIIIASAWKDFEDSEIESIENFVTNGGGLFILGLGWSWLGYHEGKTLDDFPMNKIGKMFGIKWIDGIVKDPTNNYKGTPTFHIFHDPCFPYIPPTDTTPPHIDVNIPDKVNDPYLTITGSVKDNLSGIKYLKINGVNVSISSDGSFSYTITLNEGENTITLELEDKAGNKTRETFTVNYIKKIILRLTIGSRIAYVNNEPKTLEFSPFIKNDRTMMPLRFIAEGIGAKVLWFADESKVVIIHKNTFIELWMDQGKNI